MLMKVDLCCVRVAKSGELRSSRPCFHCLQTLSHAKGVRIANVHYSTSDGVIVTEAFQTMIESLGDAVVSSGMVKKDQRRQQQQKPKKKPRKGGSPVVELAPKL